MRGSRTLNVGWERRADHNLASLSATKVYMKETQTLTIDICTYWQCRPVILSYAGPPVRERGLEGVLRGRWMGGDRVRLQPYEGDREKGSAMLEKRVRNHLTWPESWSCNWSVITRAKGDSGWKTKDKCPSRVQNILKMLHGDEARNSGEDSLAGELIDTMYKVTVAAVHAVILLGVVASSGVARAWR